MKLASWFFLTGILIALVGTVAAASRGDSNDFPLEWSLPWTSYASYSRSHQPRNIVEGGKINDDSLVVLRDRLWKMEKARASIFNEKPELSQLDKVILAHTFHPYHDMVATEVKPNLGLLIKVQEDLQKLREIEAVFDRLLVQAQRQSRFH